MRTINVSLILYCMYNPEFITKMFGFFFKQEDFGGKVSGNTLWGMCWLPFNSDGKCLHTSR